MVGLAACDFDGSNDPDSFVVRFRNDSGSPVQLALCNSDHSEACQHPRYLDEIAAGGYLDENISPGTRTEWAIETVDGVLSRCVVLFWRHYPGHAMQITLSETPIWSYPCPDSTAATSRRS